MNTPCRGNHEPSVFSTNNYLPFGLIMILAGVLVAGFASGYWREQSLNEPGVKAGVPTGVPPRPAPPYEGPAIVIRPNCVEVAGQFGKVRLQAGPSAELTTISTSFTCRFSADGDQTYKVKTTIPGEVDFYRGRFPVIWAENDPFVEWGWIAIQWWDPEFGRILIPEHGR